LSIFTTSAGRFADAGSVIGKPVSGWSGTPVVVVGATVVVVASVTVVVAAAVVDGLVVAADVVLGDVEAWLEEQAASSATASTANPHRARRARNTDRPEP
jgi:hypothetical protein